MKNILFLSIRCPNENGKGDQIILHQRIKSMLNYGCEVHLCLLKKGSVQEFDHYILKDQVKLVKTNTLSVYSIFESFINTPLNPLQVNFFFNKNIFCELKKVIADLGIDHVHNMLIRTSKYKFEVSQSIDCIDSMTLNFQRRLDSSSYFLKIPIKLETILLKKYERDLSIKFPKMFIVSNIDNKYFKNKCIVLPIGVEEVLYEENDFSKPIKLGFTGNMSYFPNEQAMVYFILRVWVKYFKSENFELQIIGRRPSPRLYNLVKDLKNIKIIGEVDNLLEYVNRNIDISIAPMRSGSGMQFKIIEAIQAKKPTLVSDLALGDINLVDKLDTLVCKKEEDYFQYTQLLKNDIQLRSKLISNAYKVIQKNYLWKSINTSFVKYLSAK